MVTETLPALPIVIETAPSAPSAVAGGAREGAARFDDLTRSLWNPPNLSADRQIGPIKNAVDLRVRDLANSDAYVHSGVELHKDSIIGDSFMLNALPNWKVLGLDETWAVEFSEEIEAKWGLSAESTNCWLDAQGTKTFTDMMRLATGIYTVGGEYLQTTEWLSRDPRRPFATCFQAIELERLCNKDGAMDTPNLRRGVKRGKFGRPIAYQIRQAYSTDITDADRFFWTEVPATKPWGRPLVTHIIDQDRPDQSRAIAALAAALGEMKMMKDFRGIALQSALVNASYAATIESELPPEAVYQALGANTDAAEIITRYGQGYLGAIARYTKNSDNIIFDGVKIPHLYPGTKLKLQPASAGSALGSDFEHSMLHYLAALLGVSFEELSRDYTGANYTTMRAAVMQTERAMRSRKKRFADRLASIMYRCWLEEQINRGQIDTMPRGGIDLYSGLNMDAITACAWIGSSRGQIDELRETQAAALRVANNFSSVEEECARLGKDYRKIYAQRKIEVDLETKNGLPRSGVLSSTAAINDNPDQTQQGASDAQAA